MTDTNPLPPLPEPEGVIVVGTQALRAFTAYQMRTYALQAIALRPVQVPMTDEEIEKINCVTLHQTDWDSFAVYEPSVRSFARAIEAHHGITAQAKKETP